MKKILVLGLLLISFQILIAKEYKYWSGGKQVTVTEDRSSMIMQFKENIDKSENMNRLSEQFPNKIKKNRKHNFMVIDFDSDRSGNAKSVIAQMDLDTTDVVYYHFCVKTEDGFKIYPTNKIVMKLKSGIVPTQIEKILVIDDFSLMQHRDNIYNLTVGSIEVVFDVANAIYESGLVEWCHPDFAAEIIFNSDPMYPDQYYLNNTGQTIDGTAGTVDIDINAPEAWEISIGSPDIIVAVIDRGVEDHEDLLDPSGQSRVLNGYPADSYGGGRPDPDDISGNDAHGQACAGIVAASHNELGVRGIAPSVKILPVNIYTDDYETWQDIADAIHWAWDDGGADVLSCSWGYPTDNIDEIRDAIDDAMTLGRDGLGCVVVSSSGNTSSNIRFPANIEAVLTVGAVDKYGTKWAYSCYGPELDIMTPSGNTNQIGDLRTIDRPGIKGYNSGDYMTNFGGTSAACPQVAGCAALILSCDPGLTMSEVSEIIKSTATPMGAPGWDEYYGWGRLNMRAALEACSVVMTNRNTVTDENIGGQLSLKKMSTGDEQIVNSIDEEPVPVVQSEIYTARTLENELSGLIHHSWNSVEDYLLKKEDFNITEEYLSYGITAKFKAQAPVTINSDYGVAIEFYDPWYYDEENQIQPDDFRPVFPGTYQVFLYQNPTFEDNIPIYNLKAPRVYATQSVICVFTGWSGSNVDFGGGATTSLDLETDVVFSSGATVIANYDPVNYSADYTVTIEPEEGLTVPAGAEINFAEGFKFIIQGDFTVAGTIDDPIVFSAINVANPWDGVLLEPTTDSHLNTILDFSYCRFEGCANFLDVAECERGATVTLQNCIVNELQYENQQIIFDFEDTGYIIRHNDMWPYSSARNIHFNIDRCTFDGGKYLMRNTNLAFPGYYHLSNTIFNSCNVYLENTATIYYQNNDFYDCAFSGSIDLADINQPLPDDEYNLAADSQFIDVINGNFHLKSTSPCIDAGYINSEYDPDNTRADIGAYYFPQLSGTLSNDITLGNEFGIIGNLTVAAGATLTIEPGTKIAADISKYLYVSGTLIAEGTTADIIQFKSKDAGSSNRWGGIRVNDGGNIRLRHTSIDNATYGVYQYFSSGTSDIQWCTFDNCYYSIYNRNNDNYPVRYCEFSNSTCGILSYYSDCAIEYNNFNNNYYGLLSYYSDNSIRYNTISNNSRGIYIYNGDPDVDRNEINSNTSYGVYITGSSGPEFTCIIYYGNNYINNYIHDNNYGVYAGSSSFPNLGTYYNSVPLHFGGFNFFENNQTYGIANYNTSYTIKAEANWWRNEPGNYGSVDVSPNADAVLGIGPYGLLKSTNTTTQIEELISKAIILETDSLFTEAIIKYDSVIVKAPNNGNAHMALIGIRRCYTKLADQLNYSKYLISLSDKYKNEIIGTDARYFQSSIFTDDGNMEKAIGELVAAIDQYDQFPDTEERQAWVVFDLAQIHEQLASSHGHLGKSTEELQVQAKYYYTKILNKYSNTEAARLVNDFMDINWIDFSDEDQATIPEEYYLYQNYPNPFNPVTTIRYQLPVAGNVKLQVFDLTGRLVQTLVDEKKQAGNYTIIWNAQNVSSGIYFYRIQADGFTSVKKCIKLK